MEEGVPQGLQRPLVVDRVQIPGDEHGGQGHHRQKEAQLLAPPDLPEPTAQGQEKQPEVQGKQQGGRGHDQVHPRQGVGGKAGILAGEAAGAGDGAWTAASYRGMPVPHSRAMTARVIAQ